MIINSEISLNYKEIIEFIEYVASIFNNDEFNRILNNIKFWNAEN